MADPLALRIGDTGTAFRITIKNQSNAIVNVSEVTTIKFTFKKPSGEIVTKNGALVNTGSDGQVQYITGAEDLDEKGVWQLQVYVALQNGSWYTDISKFDVAENLANF